LEAESIQSLTPLLQQADQWAEVLVLLPLLVALEIVLSADNAIALAAIARGLEDPASQRQALNLGLALALVFRLVLIVAAQWVLNFWPLQLLAADTCSSCRLPRQGSWRLQRMGWLQPIWSLGQRRLETQPRQPWPEPPRACRRW
jgi:hypothetical protein